MNRSIKIRKLKKTKNIKKNERKYRNSERKYRNSKRKYRKNQKTSKNKAGQVIASGGFGCVFKPALLCKDKSVRSNGVSKLLLKRDADKEYNETKKFKTIINKIPNNNYYFLIQDLQLCEPSYLDESDLQNFKECTRLAKKNIDAENVNSNLDRLRIINQPYGGVDLDKLLESGANLTHSKLVLINEKLIELIQKAIIPMNKLGLTHNDIKSANILFDDSGKDAMVYLRIIDWGFGHIHKDKSSIVPDTLINRPIQYNLPFSSILFNPDFAEFYREKLEKNGNIRNLDTKERHDLIRQIVFEYFSIYVPNTGHYNMMIKYIFPELFTNEYASQEGLHLIIDYLTEILMVFTDFKNNVFNYQNYYSRVYLKNVDIWGLLSSYINILLVLNDTEIANKEQIIEDIKGLILKFLYSNRYASKAINIEELVRAMKKMSI